MVSNIKFFIKGSSTKLLCRAPKKLNMHKKLKYKILFLLKKYKMLAVKITKNSYTGKR